MSILAGPKKGDNFRKKPTKEVNWKDLLKDIEGFKYGHGGKLKRVVTDDRSKPMLAKTKKGGKVSRRKNDFRLIFAKENLFFLHFPVSV